MMYDKRTCPCGNARPYAECCGVYIRQLRLAETAEALMRSRYSAYALGEADYLLRTWHHSTRPAMLDAGELADVKWLGLKVLAATGGGEDATRGTVEFIARCKVNGRARRLHEVSRFVREGGLWFYVDGAMPPAGDKRG